MRGVANLGRNRTIRLAVVGCLSLTASCSSAFSQDRETWRCDTPNGKYNVNEPPIGDKTTSVTGRILLHKAYFGPNWASSAKIGFHDSKLVDGDCHCNGLEVEAFHDPDSVEFYLLVDGKRTFVSSREYGIPITFKFSIDPNGIMTAEVGKEHVDTKSATLPRPARDSLRMSCSGADVSFLNIDPQ